MVKKVVTNLDLSKGFDCIPVVVLKNWDPELSFILTVFFNMCLKESFFPDSWEVSSVVPVFKNVVEKCTPKTTVQLVFFLWLVRSIELLIT